MVLQQYEELYVGYKFKLKKWKYDFLLVKYEVRWGGLPVWKHNKPKRALYSANYRQMEICRPLLIHYA